MEGKGIELDNIVRIPSTTDTIFRRWLEFLSPFHHLTGREMDVATALLKERYALSKVISANDLLENKINPRLIPNIKEEKDTFKLLLLFDMR